MAELKDIINRLTSLPDKVGELAISVLTNEEIAIMQDRLEQGLKADGSSFQEYSPNTIIIKRQTGGFISPSGNIALKDTGDFYNSMVLKKYGNYAEIDANDIHNLARFGDDILDVSDAEATEMIAQKEDELSKEIEKYLFQ